MVNFEGKQINSAMLQNIFVNRNINIDVTIFLFNLFTIL